MNANGLWRNVPNRPLLRFGTVRPRVQIPGPDQKSYSNRGLRLLRQARGGHREVTDFLGTRWRQPRPSGFRTDQLNSLTAIAKPIYQHSHGPRTGGTWVRKSKALSTPVYCRRTGQDREAPDAEFQARIALAGEFLDELENVSHR